MLGVNGGGQLGRIADSQPSRMHLPIERNGFGQGFPSRAELPHRPGGRRHSMLDVAEDFFGCESGLAGKPAVPLCREPDNGCLDRESL